MHPDTRGTARRVYVGTFHQYANQILRNGGAAALGFTPDYTVWDQQRAVETLDLTLSPRQRDLLASLRWYALNRGQWPDSPEIDARESHWRDVVAAYTGEKQWQNALDLDDLPALNAKARLPHVDGLLERRAAGPREQRLGEREAGLMAGEFDRLTRQLQQAADRSALPAKPGGGPQLNDLLVRIRGSGSLYRCPCSESAFNIQEAQEASNDQETHNH